MNHQFKIFILLFFASHSMGFGQDLSNKGKEFWVGYGSHCRMYLTTNNTLTSAPNGGTQEMVLYFTSDRDATIKVEIPATGWTRTYTLKANQVVTSDPIPKTGADDARITKEGFSGKGIHIVSDMPIIAYAHVYNDNVSGATLLFPVATLTREYYSINFTQISNEYNSYSYAYVVAVEDSTYIEIIPSVNTHMYKKGDTIRQKLNKGDIFNVFGAAISVSASNVPPTLIAEDLTGTKIRSVAYGKNTCKRIAVFSGSGKIYITCDGSRGSADNYMQQAFSANAWGKLYYTVPTKNLPNNYFRVCVKNPNTKVTRNGVPLTGLQRNFYYEFMSSTPDLIESDEPIMVSQYITTVNSCGNKNPNGDPEMIYLSPVEQTISKVTINSTGNSKILEHYVNIVIKKGGVPTLKIDGKPIENLSTAMVHPQNSNYLYFQTTLTTGSHTIESDSGFNAIAYGYGSAESYGYNAGGNVRDLYQYVTIQNKFASINYPSTCREAPFNLSITLPFKPLKLAWNFFDNKDLGKNPDPIYGTDGNPIEPDTIIKSLSNLSKELYIYKLKNADNTLREFKLKSNGVIPIDVIVNNPTADGCSGEQIIPFDITVYDPPTNEIAFQSFGCLEDSILLTSNTKTGDIPIIKYLWTVENVPQTSNSKEFKYKFDKEGLKKISLSIITNIGCVSQQYDTSVLLSHKPIPRIEPANSVCLGKSVQLLNKSTIIGTSTIDSSFWSYSDSRVLDTNTNPIKTFYDSVIIVRLDLKSNSGCKNYVIETLYAKPNPNVKISLPEVCLRDAKADFNSLTTIPPNNSLKDFIWNFGDDKSNAKDNTGIGEKVSHVYSDPGDYKISLSVTSNFGCNSTRDTMFYINGNFPKAAFNVVNQSGLCSNKPIVIENKSTVDIGKIIKLKLYWNYDGNHLLPDLIDEAPINTATYSKIFSDFHDKSSINIPIKMVVYSGSVCADSIITNVVLNGSPLNKLKQMEPICNYKGNRLLKDADITYVTDVSGTEVYSGTGVVKAGTQYYFDSKIDSGNYLIKHRYTTDRGCYTEDSGYIRVHFTPVVDAGMDITVLDDASSRILATAMGESLTYKWSPSTYLSDDNILQPSVVNPQIDMLYTLTVTGRGGCVATDVMKMTALNMVQPSNTFTPNGDGINDVWKIKYIEKYPDCDVELYNPQGNLIYKITNGKQRAWDGTINGRPMPAGTYYYIINPKNNRKKLTGYVTLLR